MKISLFIATLALLPSIAFASFDVSLKYGSRGEAVAELQELLISEGFMTGSATGNFYSLTLKAVKAFQLAHNLPSTGFFGIMSGTVANSLITQDEEIFGGVEATSTPIIPIVEQQTKDLNTKIDNMAKKIEQLSTPQPLPLTQPIMPPDLSDTFVRKINRPSKEDGVGFYIQLGAKDSNGKDISEPKINATLTKDGIEIPLSTGFSRQTREDPYDIVFSRNLTEKGTYTFTFTYGNLTKSETFEVK